MRKLASVTRHALVMHLRLDCAGKVSFMVDARRNAEA